MVTVVKPLPHTLNLIITDSRHTRTGAHRQTTETLTHLVVVDKEAYDSIIHIAHKRETQAKLEFVNSLDLFDNVSRVGARATQDLLRGACTHAD